jgi:hypothetical protein
LDSPGGLRPLGLGSDSPIKKNSKGSEKMYINLEKENQASKTNNSVNHADMKDIGEFVWCPPILNLYFKSGLARVDGPGGPVGDPPIHLDTSSVSEGTL